MEILEGHLTIKEAKNELNKLTNELELYLTKKKINFEKTQPGSITYKAIITKKTDVFDKFTHYMIKDEKLDSKIYSLQKSINAYERYIIDEMERMEKYDEIGLIKYLKEEEKKSWKEIDELLHYGYDYSRTKYKRYKKEEKKQIDPL